MSANASSPGPRGSILSGAAVERLRRGGRLGARTEVLASVGSTNDVVFERAAAGAEPGLVVCAELQTEGRGRLGRSFDSQPGLGIWASVLLEAPDDPEDCPRLSLVAGLAVAAALEAETGARCGLKWPNDVWIGGRKVCGILVEARTAGGRTIPVAGIGINVHHRGEDFPGELRERAGSLESTTGRSIDRTRLLARVLGELEALLDADRGRRLDLPARWAERDVLSGREVEVRGGEGSVCGRAIGVAGDGSLLLRVPGEGTRAFRSGEVTLRTGPGGGTPCC